MLDWNSATFPLYIIYHSFGLIRFKHNGQISALQLIYSLFINSAFLFGNSAVPFMLANTDYYLSSDTIFVYTVKVQIAIFVITFDLILISIFFKNQKLFQLYLRFKISQKYFISNEHDYKVIFYVLIFEVIIGFVIIMGLYVPDILILYGFSINGFTVGLLMGVNAFIVYLIDACYCNLLLLLRRGFRKINEKVMALSKEEMATLHLDVMKKSHFALCDLARQVNDFFEFHMLMSMLHGFLQFGYGTYIVFYTIVIDDEPSSDVYIVALWTAFYTIKFGFIFFICEITLFECEDTGRCIHRTVNKHELVVVDSSSEFREFSMQVLKNKLIFSAYGLPVDFRLMFGLIGTVLSYLVILIQFQIAAKNTLRAAHI